MLEVLVRRENGDEDLLYLCRLCRPTIDDFLTVLSEREADGDCDRCGAVEHE